MLISNSCGRLWRNALQCRRRLKNKQTGSWQFWSLELFASHYLRLSHLLSLDRLHLTIWIFAQCACGTFKQNTVQKWEKAFLNPIFSGFTFTTPKLKVKPERPIHSCVPAATPNLTLKVNQLCTQHITACPQRERYLPSMYPCSHVL